MQKSSAKQDKAGASSKPMETCQIPVLSFPFCGSSYIPNESGKALEFQGPDPDEPGSEY